MRRVSRLQQHLATDPEACDPPTHGQLQGPLTGRVRQAAAATGREWRVAVLNQEEVHGLDAGALPLRLIPLTVVYRDQSLCYGMEAVDGCRE